MNSRSTHHSTMVLGHTFNAPVGRVFTAFSDPVERGRWCARGAVASVVFDELDFRIGGRDVFRFGQNSILQFQGQALYHDIVAERRIVSTETIDLRQTRLSVAVITVEFEPIGTCTKFRLTRQSVSFDGAEMLEDMNIIYETLIDRLTRHFDGLVQRNRELRISR